MLAKLSSLIAGTLAVYPTGPTDYGWNGGCMTLPASRWQAGVVSQWRNADTARPNPKSWHAEQMKLYLDLHDEANEGATKYDDFAYVDDTYFELVFDVNLFNLGATFNPFYPVQLDQTFTKADGTTATQGLWYSTEGCCTLHVEVDDKEQGRDLLDGSISNDYLEWQWTNHPGTWFTYADHITEVRMCQHPSTTNNGYDTWFNGPSTVDATHVGAAETSGCTVLDCASDFRWVTHWDGSGGCCNAVDAPYTTRTGQIAIDGDFGPLNQGDFFEVALDGQLFDINQINGGNFVTVENIQDNAYRFFVDTDSFNGQRQFNLETMRFEKSGGTGIFANYQLWFIGANSFVKPECKWIQLCRAGTAQTTTAAVTTTAAPPCSDPAACDPTWGTCVVVTDSGGVDHEDCQCAADYQGEKCESLCPLGDQDKVDISFVINMAGADNNGLSGHINDFVKDTLKMYDTNNNVRVALHTCGGVSHYTEWITAPEHRTNADWEATFSSVLSSGFTGANAADCTQAVYKAEAGLDITDDIPDIMIIISDGEDLNTVSLSGAIDSVKNNHVTLMAVGYPDEGTSSSDGTELTVLAGGDAANCFNCGTSDHITGNVDFTSIFNIICNAPPPPDVCDNNGGCVNGVCSTFIAPDGMEHADCQCDSGFQGQYCNEPCVLPGPDDRVDVFFLLDYSGAVVDPNVHVQPKDLIDQLVRDFDTLDKVKIGLGNYASTLNVEIGPVQNISPEHADPIIWGQQWPNDPITNTPTAIQFAAQQFDTTDDIPDILIIVTDGHIHPA